ncbi:MAG: hypothetical protein ACOYOK_10330 [Pseudobdellovibrionaceae bacterium]
MKRIITLLEEKNHYLEKFYALNENELLNLKQGNFDSLESFYKTREKILEILNYIDSKLDEAEKKLSEDYEIKSDEKIKIIENLQIKDQYVSRILVQDLEVISCIEVAKSNLIKELQEVKKVKKAVGSYKSKVFEQKLDEEA